MASVLSLNVATGTLDKPYAKRPTGIGKRSVPGPVAVREPGSKLEGLGSGLVGDVIGDHRHHGGTDQAVYAFSRENLDRWQRHLNRELPNGFFGENLTTVGIDVDEALIGERWRIGTTVLQVTVPRVPCATFRGWVGQPGWLKTFVADERPGAYFRVVTGGEIRRGDEIEVVHRPAHDVTIALTFRAVLREPGLLHQLLAAGDDLPDDVRETVASGTTLTIDR